MDKYTELITELTDAFKNVHEDSQYSYPERKGGVDLFLVFDIRFNSSNTPHRRTATIDVSIFNAGSPARTFDLIDKIEQYFTDGLIETDDFLLKFDRYAPISSKQRIDTRGVFHYELMMDVICYDKGTNQPDHIQRLN